ncbi:MAG: hypothetical protein GKR88_00145 [Flavobacteriaceae bacterium]|nr:MAG: hypothetical protein GKR88_00145 [Flavobacteriaceae bacterium]
MRFHKFISTLLHPIVTPTVGIILYFIFVPHALTKEQHFFILALVFGATYIIPIFMLLVLKGIGLIESFGLHTIRERKIPLFLMMVVFYCLGKSLLGISLIRDFAVLFYGTSFSLVWLYFLFIIKLKVSIHLVSMGNALGFFLVLIGMYNLNLLPVLMIMIVLSGLLASARLHLKAHTPTEVYLGFFIGMISQFLVGGFL